jgi:hypothetical protein
MTFTAEPVALGSIVAVSVMVALWLKNWTMRTTVLTTEQKIIRDGA